MWVRGGRLRVRFCYPLEPLLSFLYSFALSEYPASIWGGAVLAVLSVTDTRRKDECSWATQSGRRFLQDSSAVSSARQEANWVGFLILPFLCLPRWSSVEPSRTTVLAICLQKQAWLQGSTRNINDLLWYGWEKHGCITLWKWIPANVMKFP